MRPRAILPGGREGSVLVGLLWCVALLAMVVIGVLHSARLDLMVVKGHGDEIQAHYLALAGVEKAKALLFHDALERRRSGRNHTGDLYDAPEHFKDVEFGRGQFRVIRQGGDGRGIVYGVSDEESRLDLNHVAETELMGLEGMTEGVVAAIADWRDPDDVAKDGGAEVDYYASLDPPRLPRNGPMQTLRELGMVRNVPRDLWLGEDGNLNGLLDPEEDDGSTEWPPDNADGFLDQGWAGHMTIYAGVRNVSAAGELRLNLQKADEAALRNIRGMSPEVARAIVAYREGGGQFESLGDLLQVTAGVPQGGGADIGAVVAAGGAVMRGGQMVPGMTPGSPVVVAGGGSVTQGMPTVVPGGGQRVGQMGVPSGGGVPVVTAELLMEIADDLTVVEETTLKGVVNVNTASEEVLRCLPGVDRPLARAIVAYRGSAGFFPNIAWLMKVDGMDGARFRELAQRVTARSETYRILSEGQVGSTGARKRMLVTVRVGALRVDTLGYREDHL